MIKLSKKQAAVYKQRWREVESVQIQELQTTPMSSKFKQLCLLMNSFNPSRPAPDREKKIDAIRRRWIMLRKNGIQ